MIMTGFYSLHRETYSVTIAGFEDRATVWREVSIRCIARRTA